MKTHTTTVTTTLVRLLRCAGLWLALCGCALRTERAAGRDAIDADAPRPIDSGLSDAPEASAPETAAGDADTGAGGVPSDCSNIPGITNAIYIPGPGPGAYLDLGVTPYKRFYSFDYGELDGRMAVVLAFKTPAATGNSVGYVSMAEIGASPTSRLEILSTAPCATLGGGYLEVSHGSTSTIRFTVGGNTGYAVLQPSTVYYVTFTNRFRSGSSWLDSCGSKDCTAAVDISSP